MDQAEFERRRWESERRYYCAVLHKDLLGEWVVDVCWGGKYNRLGGHDTTYVPSFEAGLATLLDLDKVRQARRYAMVIPNSD